MNDCFSDNISIVQFGVNISNRQIEFHLLQLVEFIVGSHILKVDKQLSESYDFSQVPVDRAGPSLNLSISDNIVLKLEAI